mmetsp:Transcript_54555/g.117214  ORF Transcript_54555/g.117214 Transcript_54555/m.117214 type:complete len:216 (-) Transcript_54555:610-1257(-)
MRPDCAPPGKRQAASLPIVQVVKKHGVGFVGETHICGADHGAGTAAQVDQRALLNPRLHFLHELACEDGEHVLHEVRVPTVHGNNICGVQELQEALRCCRAGARLGQWLREHHLPLRLQLENRLLHFIASQEVEDANVGESVLVEAETSKAAAIGGCVITAPASVQTMKALRRLPNQVNRCGHACGVVVDTHGLAEVLILAIPERVLQENSILQN